ncbi:hypothetical protein GCM10010315_15410 [Streptomyces luteosporeus]|uniref:Uncharacterized protein n=1 Tax=Streptomyces luteosporeus TaxID=173856 RepID=A0ABN3TMJ3_9ACTN
MERPVRAPQGIDLSRDLDRAVCSAPLTTPQQDARTARRSTTPDGNPVRSGEPGVGWRP